MSPWRKASGGRRTPCSRDRRARADPRPAPDRAPEHGRAGAPRRLPDEGARAARLRHDARRRLARPRRELDVVRRRRARRRHRPDPAAPPRDLAALRLAVGDAARAADPAGAAAHPAHAHGEGGRRRPARGPARRWCAAADRRPHVPRTCPPRVLRPRHDGCLSRPRTRPRDHDDPPDRGQPGGPRRPRRARRGAGGEVHRDPPRHRSRPAHHEQRERRHRAASPVRRPGGRLRRRLDRPDDGDQARSRTSSPPSPGCATRDRRPALPRRRRPRPRGGRAARARARRLPAHAVPRLPA